jgi:hypothetical protein
LFSIAGLDVELDLPEHPAAQAVRRAWGPFRVDAPLAGAARIELQIDPERPAATEPVAPAVEVRPDGSVALEGGSFTAEVGADRRTVRIRGAAERFGVESAAKWLLADWLARDGGLLVHGVALRAGERAALFTGPSGAGKSTLGKWASSGGLELLSDELVAVRPAGARYQASATPWNLGRPVTAELRAVGVLSWAPAPVVQPVPASEVLRVLLNNVLLPDPSPAGRMAAFRAAARLLDAVAPVRLAFAPEAGVAGVLGTLLQTGP